MTYPLLAAILFSLAAIMMLWRSDPKRRRVMRLPEMDHDAIKRRLQFGAALLPGCFLAASGDSAAVLIWLGSCVLGGWLVAQWSGRRHRVP